MEVLVVGSLEREVRKLRKSLRQIESLERLDRELTSDELQKVETVLFILTNTV